MIFLMNLSIFCQNFLIIRIIPIKTDSKRVVKIFKKPDTGYRQFGLSDLRYCYYPDPNASLVVSVGQKWPNWEISHIWISLFRKKPHLALPLFSQILLLFILKPKNNTAYSFRKKLKLDKTIPKNIIYLFQ